MEAETEYVSVFSDDLRARLKLQRASLLNKSASAALNVSSASNNGEEDDSFEMIESDKEDDGFLSIDDVDESYLNHSSSTEKVQQHISWMQEASPSNFPPWMDTSEEALQHNLEAPFMARLHNEIVDFCKYMAPSEAEQETREDVVDSIRQAVQSIWPEAQLVMFGSMMTGTYLPFADIDQCILRKGSSYEEEGVASRQRSFLNGKMTNVEECAYSHKIFSKLAAYLKKQQLVDKVEVLAKARVPILKFVDSATGLKIDICLNVDSGIHTGKFIQEKMIEFPALKPLTFVLKYFVYCRGLSETYTGGVGSFLLQCLIISMLQKHPLRNRKVENSPYYELDAYSNLGCLLYYFFVHYGTVFSYPRQEAHVNGSGNICRKNKNRASATFNNRNIGPTMSLINPCDKDHDVSANSWRFITVKRAFKLAAGIITSYANKAADIPCYEQPEETVLQCLLPICPELVQVRPTAEYTEEQRQDIYAKINESIEKQRQVHNNRKGVFSTEKPTDQATDAMQMLQGVMSSVKLGKKEPVKDIAAEEEKKKKKKEEKNAKKAAKNERIAAEQAAQLVKEEKVKEYIAKENAMHENKVRKNNGVDSDSEDMKDHGVVDASSAAKTLATKQAKNARKKERQKQRKAEVQQAALLAAAKDTSSQEALDVEDLLTKTMPCIPATPNIIENTTEELNVEQILAGAAMSPATPTSNLKRKSYSQEVIDVENEEYNIAHHDSDDDMQVVSVYIPTRTNPANTKTKKNENIHNTQNSHSQKHTQKETQKKQVTKRNKRMKK